MHVKFSCQSELPKLPGISRNKPHLELWPESPAANSPVSLGRVAGSSPDLAGRSASSWPNQQSICTILSLSQIESRTVRLTYADGPRFSQKACFHPTRSAPDRRTVRQMVRRLEPDGPLLPIRTVRCSQSGRSAFSCSLPLHLAMINPHMYYMSSPLLS